MWVESGDKQQSKNWESHHPGEAKIKIQGGGEEKRAAILESSVGDRAALIGLILFPFIIIPTPQRSYFSKTSLEPILSNFSLSLSLSLSIFVSRV